MGGRNGRGEEGVGMGAEGKESTEEGLGSGGEGSSQEGERPEGDATVQARMEGQIGIGEDGDGRGDDGMLNGIENQGLQFFSAVQGQMERFQGQVERLQQQIERFQQQDIPLGIKAGKVVAAAAALGFTAAAGVVALRVPDGWEEEMGDGSWKREKEVVEKGGSWMVGSGDAGRGDGGEGRERREGKEESDGKKEKDKKQQQQQQEEEQRKQQQEEKEKEKEQEQGKGQEEQEKGQEQRGLGRKEMGKRARGAEVGVMVETEESAVAGGRRKGGRGELEGSEGGGEGWRGVRRKRWVGLLGGDEEDEEGGWEGRGEARGYTVEGFLDVPSGGDGVVAASAGGAAAASAVFGGAGSVATTGDGVPSGGDGVPSGRDGVVAASAASAAFGGAGSKATTDIAIGSKGGAEEAVAGASSKEAADAAETAEEEAAGASSKEAAVSVGKEIAAATTALFAAVAMARIASALSAAAAASTGSGSGSSTVAPAKESGGEFPTAAFPSPTLSASASAPLPAAFPTVDRRENSSIAPPARAPVSVRGAAQPTEAKERAGAEIRAAAKERFAMEGRAVADERTVAEGRAVADERTVAEGRAVADERTVAEGRAVADERTVAEGRAVADERTVAEGRAVADERTVAEGRAVADERTVAEGRAVADERTVAEGSAVADERTVAEGRVSTQREEPDSAMDTSMDRVFRNKGERMADSSNDPASRAAPAAAAEGVAGGGRAVADNRVVLGGRAVAGREVPDSAMDTSMDRVFRRNGRWEVEASGGGRSGRLDAGEDLGEDAGEEPAKIMSAVTMQTAAAVKPSAFVGSTSLKASQHKRLQMAAPSRASAAGVRCSAVRSERLWTPNSAANSGDIWSIKNDLEVPQSLFMGAPEVMAGQGAPPPMLQERFQSVISQLFQNRIIRCGGAVDDDMANLIVAQLLYLDAVDPTKDIIMYVNSPGGSVTAGMAIFDTMRHIRPDVSTVCVGLAASMGAFLLSAGTKGKRYSLPNSRIMIHQPLGGAQGQQTDIEIQANEILHHKANLNGYLAYHTGQSYNQIVQDTDRDFFMSATEAKEYGLIDAVITNPLKALNAAPVAA
ncbi:unnamed protein product [Closterium sp. Naga37s-1]|nr:unnamed protein product [Closterium sp. Naga37s-1]